MQPLLSGSSAEIALASSILEAAGLFCETRNEAISQAMVGVPFETELWVREEDLEEALQLVRAGKSAEA